MRKLPTILAALFLFITLWRVATFAAEAMQAGALGWLFSIGLGGAVYGSAYWTRVSASNGKGQEDKRSRATRFAAWAALVAFVAADGYFNLIEVLRVVRDPALVVAAYIYGAFPTLAVALLGWLQGNVDRIPKPPKAHKGADAFAVVRNLWGQREVVRVEAPSLAAPAAFPCPTCGRGFEKQQALAAHLRSHKKVEAVG